MKTILKVAALCVAMAGCSASGSKLGEMADLGAFKLGHNVVVSENATKGPFSRTASTEELQASLVAEIDRRIGRYTGTQFYHLGVSIDGYILALPGIPVVASPKSAMILSVRVWDDAAGVKLTEEPEQITVLESFSGGNLVGSGLTRSKEEQLQNLSENAALAIERYLQENAAWFVAKETVTLPADVVGSGGPESEAAKSAPVPRPTNG